MCITKRIFILLLLFLLFTLVTAFGEKKQFQVNITQWRVSVENGRSHTFEGDITNNTDADISKIDLSLDVPLSLAASVMPKTMHIPAKAKQSFTVTVMPEESIFQYDEKIIVYASSAESGDSDSMTIVVTPSPLLWPVFGGILGLLIVCGFVIMFIRMNKD